MSFFQNYDINLYEKNIPYIEPQPIESKEIVNRLSGLLTSIQNNEDLDPLMEIKTALKAIDKTRNILEHAIDNDSEIHKGLSDVLEQTNETPWQKSRQLKEINLYLTLLSDHSYGNQKLSIARLVHKVKEASEVFTQILHPPWHTHLKKIEEVLKQSLSVTGPIVKAKSILSTHRGVPVNTKQFLHIHAETIIKNTPYEGFNSLTMFHYLKHFLESNRTNYPSLSHNLSLLTMLADIEELSKTYAFVIWNLEDFQKKSKEFKTLFTKIIENLKQGEKTLLEIGWVGEKLGHSMKLSIEKKEKEECLLTIYNTGGGIEDYHPVILFEEKWLYQPFIKIDFVEKKRLLDPDYMQALFEFLTIIKDPITEQSTHYSAKDLYSFFIKALGGTLVPCDGDRDKFLLPAASGICTWSSLIAVLFEILPRKEYFQILCDISIDSLCAYYQSVQKNITDEAYLALEHAFVHAAQTTLDAYKNQAISEERLGEIYTTLNELQTKLEGLEWEASTKQTITESINFDNLAPLNQLTQKIPRLDIPLNRNLDHNKQKLRKSEIHEAISFKWIDSPIKFHEGVAQLLEFLPTTEVENQIGMLDIFFKKVSDRDINFWLLVPLDNKKQLIVYFANLTEYLFKLIKDDPEKYPSFTTYAFYLYSLILILGKDFSEFKFSRTSQLYKNYLEETFGSYELGYLQKDVNLYSPENRKLRAFALENTQTLQQEGEPYFCFATQSITDRTKIAIEPAYRRAYDLNYISNYLKNHPELSQTLSHDFPMYKNELYNRKFQIALLACDWYGKYLPATFCALRRQEIMVKCFLKNKNMNIGKTNIFSDSVPEIENSTVYLKVKSKRYLNDLEESYYFVENYLFEKKFQFENRNYHTKLFYASEKDAMLQLKQSFDRDLMLMICKGDVNDTHQYLEQQVVKTLAYFIAHLELLEDNAMRIFMRYLLFECDYIEKILEINPVFGNTISNFVSKGLHYFTEKGNIASIAFFIDIGRNLEHIFRFNGNTTEFIDFKSEILNLLNDKKLNPQEKTLLYQQLLGNYAHDAENKLSVDDVPHLLTAIFYSKAHPTTSPSTTYLKEELNIAKIRHSDYIKETLLKNPKEICNHIIRLITDRVTNLEWNSSQYPICESQDQNSIIDFQEFEIYIDHHSLCGISEKILRNSNYKEFFGELNFICERIADSHYKFKDSNGYETEVILFNHFGFEELKIYQKLEDGKWYQYWSPKRHNTEWLSQLPKDFHDFVRDSTLWLPLNKNESNKIYIRNTEQQITHAISFTSSSHSFRSFSHREVIDKCIKYIHTEDPLFLVNLKDTSNSALEKVLGHAMLWENQQGKLVELEVPSLNLSFACHEEDGIIKAHSTEYPGYYIASNQTYRGIGLIPKALVLENDTGQRKLVLPYGAIKPKDGPLTTEFFIDSNKRSITFNLDLVSKPIAKSKEQQIYLASLLFARKKYLQAQTLLKNSYSQVLPYKDKEKALLTQMFNLGWESQDFSPHATSVILTLLALFPSIQIDPLKKLADPERLITMYFDYKQLQFTIPHLALSKDQEMIALNTIDHHSMHSSTNQREQIKKILKEQKITSPFDSNSIEHKISFEHSISHERETELDPLIEPEKRSLLITRKNDLKFMEMCRLARVDPPKLELYLIGSEIDDRISPYISLWKAISHGFEVDLAKLNKVYLEFKKYSDDVSTNSFSNILIEADRFEKQWQANHTTNFIITAKGHFPKRHQMKQSIQIKQRPTSTHPPPINFSLKRHHFLTDRQMRTYFQQKDNQGLTLSAEEIQSLQNAIQERGPKILPQESKDLAQYIHTYWNLAIHSKDWNFLDPKQSEKLKTLLLVQSAEFGKQADIQRIHLLNLANRLPENLRKKIIFSTEKFGNIRQEITLNNLMIFTARSSHFTLGDKNPQIQRHESELLNSCLIYLDLKAQQQQLNRAVDNLSQMEKLESNTKDYARLSEALFQELTRKLPYNPSKNPELLIFEVLGEIGLHQWQVNDLMRLLEPKPGENPNVILEKVMGSGKSKVYLPLLALKKADGDHLSLIIVHSSQYETVAESLHISSSQVFNQVAHTLFFSRDSDTSLRALTEIRDQMNQVREHRQFYILTDKSMHSLGLAFDELWIEFLSKEKVDLQLLERINMLREILSLIKTKGKATFDEADLLLNCRYEVVYSLGEAKMINPSHANSIADLYRAIFPILDEVKTLTKEVYQNIKPKLLVAFIEKIVEKQMPHLDSDLVLAYLNGNDYGLQYVKTLSEQERNILAIAYYEFHELLPIVLNKRCGEHYGYSDDPKKILPVPYVASGIPSPTSEFSFPYALLSYTMQTLKYSGISSAIIKNRIENLQYLAQKEMKTKPNLPLQQTNAYQKFLKLCGPNLKLPFLKINANEIQMIAEELKKNPDHIYSLAKEHIFPYAMQQLQKITSTPYTLFNMFKEVQGFTGTPWNQKTYPANLEVSRDILSSGKTQGIIWKNSQTVHTLASNKFEEIIEQLANFLKKDIYHAFIDVGAVFNGIENDSIAKNLLNCLSSKFKGVLFYQDNLPYVMERSKRNLVPYEKYGSTDSLFIFYDQWHTTGTDYKIHGKSLLTLSKNTKMRDLEQGYMRDRQAELGKRIDFLPLLEAQQFLLAELNLNPQKKIETADILRGTEIVQEKELEDLIFIGTFGKIKEVIHNHLRTHLLDQDLNISQLKEQKKHFLNLLREKVKDAPWEQLGQFKSQVEAEVFFDKIIKNVAKLMLPLLNEQFTEAMLLDELWHCVDLSLFPNPLSEASINSPEQLMEQEQQAHVQQENLVLVQKEVENITSHRNGVIQWSWNPNASTKSEDYYQIKDCKIFTQDQIPELKYFKGIKFPLYQSQPPFFLISNIFENDPLLRDYADVFDIEVSYNFLPPTGYATSQAMGPFSEGQLNVQNMLLCKNTKTGEVQLRLISQADAGFFFEKLKKDLNSKGDIETALYNLKLEIIQSNHSDLLEKGSLDFIDDQMKNKIVQAKFYNGESLYTDEEITYLKSWISKKGIEKMKNLFFKHILVHKPEKILEYEVSDLHEIFFPKRSNFL